MAKVRIPTASRRPGWFVYTVLCVVILIGLFPFYWTFLIGSGDQSTFARFDAFDINSWIPAGNFAANVQTVLNNSAVGYWRSLGSSLIVSITVSLTTVLFATLAGFAFAKLRFRGSEKLLIFVIATMAVPVQLGVVPLYIVFFKLGMVGNLSSVIIPGLVSAFGVFWMTQYIRQALPDELIEAARVDGCGTLRTFWSIVLPAARPAAAMLALFTFIASWTNFFWPYITLGNSDNKTLPVALQVLSANYFVDFSIVMTGVLMSTIPLIILFVVAGKQLVSGIMQGAVKG
jgi:cellobiose transport system permease protein